MIPANPNGQSHDAEPRRTPEISDPLFTPDGVRFVTVYSPALKGRGDFTVFLPPEGESQSSVPIVVLLHGVYGSHWSWFFQGGAHQTARDLIAARRVRPMLLVAPSDGLFQDGSGYLRHSGRDYEAWIVTDVLSQIRRIFPCADDKSPVFLAGLSMGGYGALRLGAKYPRLYRGISAHSAVTTIEDLQSFLVEPFPIEQIGAKEINLLYWFEHNRPLLPPVRFDCGTRDRLLEANRRFHHALDQKGIAHHYIEVPGEHNWEYWHAHIGSSLLFFEQILRASTLSGG